MSLQGQFPVQFGRCSRPARMRPGGSRWCGTSTGPTADRPVQQADKDTGLPLWVIEVIDPQEDTRQRTVKVKIAAQYQPVLPAPGARVAVHAGGVRGTDRHPVRGCFPVPCQGDGQVRRPAGVLV